MSHSRLSCRKLALATLGGNFNQTGEIANSRKRIIVQGNPIGYASHVRWVWAVIMITRATDSRSDAQTAFANFLREKKTFGETYPQGRPQPKRKEPGKNLASRESGRRMRYFKCNSPDRQPSSCPEKQLYAEEHGAVAPAQSLLVGGMRK